MITIHFDFENHEEMDDEMVLQQLNALLATMKLSHLDLEDTKGYLAVTRDGDGNLLKKCYGLNSGKLVCKLADGGEGYCYQIDSMVTDKSVDHNTFINGWRERHPDRIVRTVMTIGFQEDNAHIILHHQKG